MINSATDYNRPSARYVQVTRQIVYPYSHRKNSCVGAFYLDIQLHPLFIHAQFMIYTKFYF